MQDYKFVWNKENGKTFAYSIDDGYDALLNNNAGKIFSDIHFRKSSVNEINLLHPEFVKDSLKYGWFKENKLNGSFVSVNKNPHLTHVQIELTRHCNLKCSYCYSFSGPFIKNKLDLSTVEKILLDAEKMGVIWIDFTGGEPLLHPEWKTILKSARDKGFIISLHTNGTVLSEEVLSYLSEIRIKHLQISLDSHKEEIHDSIRGLKGAFRKTVKNIKAAKKLGFEIKVSVVAHKQNRSSFADTVTWLRDELGVDVLMDRVIAMGRELEENTGITTKDYYELIAPLLKRDIEESKICSSKKESAENLAPHCGIGNSYAYITAEGEVAMCPTMTSRDGKIFKNPNINDVNLMEAWYDSKLFTSYRYINCKNVNICPSGNECRGGCRSNAYIEGGKIDSPDLLACNINKNPSNNFKLFEYPE